ncbi:hypothetical protein [Burkholderia sp. Bp8990]|uniref:hypothetical protein n=1 Tax=Burkholderia sp. Bp8990 TaxID=2184552 RepID=UPI001625C1BD|nr:hypothetical protein [Burkholderia sp. Bp8990]
MSAAGAAEYSVAGQRDEIGIRRTPVFAKTAFALAERGANLYAVACRVLGRRQAAGYTGRDGRFRAGERERTPVPVRASRTKQFAARASASAMRASSAASDCSGSTAAVQSAAIDSSAAQILASPFPVCRTRYVARVAASRSPDLACRRVARMRCGRLLQASSILGMPS